MSLMKFVFQGLQEKRGSRATRELKGQSESAVSMEKRGKLGLLVPEVCILSLISINTF